MTALRNATILNTRPMQQSGDLIKCLEAAGGRVFTCPVFTVHAIEHVPALNALPAGYDLLIFTSSHAVAQLHDASWIKAAHNVKIAAVGAGTAAALAKRDIRVDVCPKDGAGSDALLKEPSLHQVSDKSIAIICGADSRSTLATTLTVRGATVCQIHVYRRAPISDPTPLLTIISQHQPQFVIASSVAALKNLYDLASRIHLNWLQSVNIVVPSERIADTGKVLGLENIVLAASALPAHLTHAIEQIACDGDVTD